MWRSVPWRGSGSTAAAPTSPPFSQYAAQPTPDRPDGAIITTTVPKRWQGEPVRVLDLNA